MLTSSKILYFLLIVYVFIFSVWPFYIDIRIAENLGINPQRILVAIITTLVILFFIYDKSFRRKLKQKIILINEINFIIVIYIALRLISAISSSSSISYLLFTYELIFHIFLFYISYFLVSKSNIKLLLLVLTLSALSVSIFGLLEFFFQENIFRDIVQNSTNQAARVALEKNFRFGLYRIQSSFENSLSLAQYLLLVIPLIVGNSLLIKNRIQRYFIGILCWATLFLTFSRFAIFFILLIYFLYFLVKTDKKIKISLLYKYILRIIIFSTISISITVVLFFAESTITNKEIANSSSARIIQLIYGWQAIQASPIIGYGQGNAVSILLNTSNTEDPDTKLWHESIDNLFLTKALESGVITVILYIYFFFLICRKLFRAYNLNMLNTHMSNFLLMGLITISCVFMSLSVLSLHTILPVLYIVTGALLSISLSLPPPRNYNIH